MPHTIPTAPPLLSPSDVDGEVVSATTVRHVLRLLEHTIALAFYVIQQTAPSERRASHLACIAMARRHIETALEEAEEAGSEA